MTDHPTPDPPCFVCRCEEVTAQRIAEAISAGATSLNDLKRRTRAGMGLCQGAYCLPEIARILADQTDRSVDQIEPMTSRPPARAVTLDVLARSEE
jgi:NAD(P)H-nitrite reductase large subunit